MTTRHRAPPANGNIAPLGSSKYNTNGSISHPGPQGQTQGRNSGHQNQELSTTDLSRWRLRDNNGRLTWHYLISDEEVKLWPQTRADKHHLGLDVDLPDLPEPHGNALQAARNGLSYFSHMQLPHGEWGCQYGGPMFLLPGLVVTLYVTDLPLTQPEQTEVIRYIFNMQNVGAKNGGDGGWGLHIEGDSTVFGTALNYTSLRLLGVPANHPRMVIARQCLHNLGGALNGPHWAKFWLSVLGVTDWAVVNPVPPEIWLLPDWTPISPWRWWIHMRQVFLPMGLLWSRKWTYARADSDPIIKELRRELFTEAVEHIDWPAHRNDIHARDNYNPKSWLLNFVNWLLVVLWVPYLRTASIVERAEAWAWRLVQIEDANSDFACLAPVNAPMNLLCCYMQEGAEAESVRKHRECLQEFLWMSGDGLMCNGTNGVQNWDTSFAIQAAVSSELATDQEHHETLRKALEFLESQQILDHPVGFEEIAGYSDPPTARTGPEAGYRHARRGAWGFSNKIQGYTVSDCTSEALKSILLLQNTYDPKDPSRRLFPAVVSDQRLKWAADILLTMQNANGACSSYEISRGSEYLEFLNAAEVFGRIMVEYDYPECTTACVTTLNLFSKYYPDYRADEIRRFTAGAVEYIRRAQRADGSWFGSWGICFTYAGMFALESLSTQGETHSNSERVRRACDFFLEKQNEDGGWGESYRSCETGRWCQHPEGSQVVQTAWVIIALLEAQFPYQEHLARAVALLMSRQQPNGEWLQEGIEGVFNKSCMISYPNYKYIFPIKALGMYARRFGGGSGNGNGHVV